MGRRAGCDEVMAVARAGHLGLSQIDYASLAHLCPYGRPGATSLQWTRANCQVMQDQYEGDIMWQGEDRAGQRFGLFPLLCKNRTAFLR